MNLATDCMEISANADKVEGPKVTKGARTRALIKHQIIELVGKSNPQDVTLQQICAAADVTVGSFYFHFKTKDAALEDTAIDAIRSHYSEVSALADSPITNGLEALMGAFVENYASHESRTRLIRLVIHSNPVAHEVWETERGALSRKLERKINEARQEKGGPSVLSFFTAEFLLTATESFLDQLFFGTDERLQLAVGSPDLLIKNIAAIWERTILNDNRIGDYL